MSGSATPLARRVLVVDDEPTIRDLLAELLRSAGYEVTTADNGVTAFALLDRSAPHVILLDLMMPVMDGFAFRARQLLTARLATIPVIVLSATHDLHLAVQALRPHAYFSKPFDLDVLLSSVDDACLGAPVADGGC